MFSSRTNWDREESALARAAWLYVGRKVDLTASNPTRCGLGFAPETLLRTLKVEDAARYDPQPFGRLAAREAVAAYYRAPVDPAEICLTASTSEAYSFLFRLLCEPGDEILIASPSYPLFDHLAALDDIRLVPYPLFYDHGWQIEPGAVEARIGPRTRALVLVHPNNPTGHFVSAAERAALERLCADRDLALIVDEVFLDYAWAGQGARSFAEGPHPALCFVLSGLSKVCALPQMKVGWCAVFGPEQARREALARLEIVADAYLSVGALPQAALPGWLAGRGPVQAGVRTRVLGNLLALDAMLTGTPVSRLVGEGGWSAVLRIPALEPDESWAVRLLARTGTLVQPGAPFGFPPSGWVVVSLLPEPEVFRAGIAAMLGSFG